MNKTLWAIVVLEKDNKIVSIKPSQLMRPCADQECE